jgi:hypothetical protein
MLSKLLHLNTNLLGETQGEGIVEIRGLKLSNTITMIHVWH